MADNIGATPGSGTTLATDDVSGVHYPRVKIATGADGSAADITSANPLPAQLTQELPAGTKKIGVIDVDVITQPTAPVSGTQTANTAGNQLGSGALKIGVHIKNPTANSDNVEVIADGSATGDLLTPGERNFYAVSNLNKLIVKRTGASDQSVRFFGS